MGSADIILDLVRAVRRDQSSSHLMLSEAGSCALRRDFPTRSWT